MSDRYQLRARYIEGWYEMDAQKLLTATTDDFLFDDPKEPEPVTRADLPGYMERWRNRVNNMNEWNLQHYVREDKDGTLTDWHWWELVGTGIAGAAVVKTSNAGVFLERLAYFERNADTVAR